LFDYLSSVCSEGNLIWGVGKQPDEERYSGYLQRDADELYAVFLDKNLEVMLKEMLETAGKRKLN
jgi:hypothetical protein